MDYRRKILEKSLRNSVKKEEAFDIIDDAYKKTCKEGTSQATVCVTKLMEHNAFKWPLGCEEMCIVGKKQCLREAFRRGEKGFSFEDFVEEGYTDLKFISEMDKEGNIFDYANLQTILYLLNPFYKKLFSKKIHEYKKKEVERNTYILYTRKN